MNIEKLTKEINQTLHFEVNRLAKEIIEIDDQLLPVANAFNEYLGEGKRFRPIFALLGYIGGGGQLSPEIYKAVSALEFLQASALIHDDLMDSSDTRRGKPSIHKQFELQHGAKFGAAAAILIGDLALIWSEQVLQESAYRNLANVNEPEVNKVFAKMRSELMAGQFLDVYEQTQREFSVERSLKIARYKSGKYSIERPLHFGAALTGRRDLTNLYQIYSEYGLPLGEAFQLRDDLLGVFGDPETTGKPAGDDLIEGKRTALIAYAFDRGSERAKKLLLEKLGHELSDSEIAQLREAIEETGAVIHVEDLIEKLSECALDALSGYSFESAEIAPEAKALLEEMVSLVTKRSR